ncbi:unnamed protein product [Laminaria digitata]
MNEAILMRTLRQYRKVRGPDFHQPATRQNQGKLENGDGIEKRQPLSKEERAEAEILLAAAVAGGGGGGPENEASPELGEGGAGDGAGANGVGAELDLIAPGEFLKEFDAWVDTKYPEDRGSATKLKVAFRKQHRAAVADLCLEDIEDVAQAMQ